MPTDLELQLARLAEAIDGDAPPISIDDIAGRAVVDVDVDRLELPDRGTFNDAAHRWRLDDEGGSKLEIALGPHPERSKRPVWLTAAAAIVLITGAIALFLNRADDDRISSVDTPTTTSVQETATIPPDATRGGWWPQSTLDEVRAAQELADAGDPAFSWQLDDQLARDENPWGAEIFARFIEEELGWEEFAGASFAGYVYGDAGGDIDGILFIRCAAGETNPLSSLYGDAPREIRDCAPTIDDLTYETVRFGVHQPGRSGPSGIWVIDTWEILQSEPDADVGWAPLSPDYLVQDLGPIEQDVPPPDGEVTALVQAFLRARVAGVGAERFLFGNPVPLSDDQVPLLYAASSGSPYERFGIQRLQGPVWPTGWSEYEVRLTAEDGTVVAQRFHVIRDPSDQLRLMYGAAEPDVRTTENGESVAVPQSEFLDTLTFTAPPLVPRGDGVVEVPIAGGDGQLILQPDPQPWPCETGAVPADAEGFARSVMRTPGFETTDPEPASIAGLDGLQLDAAFTEETACWDLWMRELPAGDPGWRTRLYLLEYPDGWVAPGESGWAPQVLTIAITASEDDFERVLEDAAPVVESLELQPG